jgi:hypothetical protein
MYVSHLCLKFKIHNKNMFDANNGIRTFVSFHLLNVNKFIIVHLSYGKSIK